MLQIRPQQMKTLSQRMLDDFVEEMVTHLIAIYPADTSKKTLDGLRAFVIGGISEAEEYGIIYQPDIRRFLEFITPRGSDWEERVESSWALTLLRDQHLSGTAKMDRIDDQELLVAKRDRQ